MMSAQRKRKSELSHGRILGEIELVLWSSIRPSPQNDTIYGPVDPSDPDVQALAASVGEHGIREPLVITLDGFILSGHRRYAAAKVAGLREIPCRRENIQSTDPGFVVLLREYNRQRVKGIDVVLREEIISANPDDAYDELIQYRRDAARVKVETGIIRGEKRRAEITDAKKPFLDAIQSILDRLRSFWPLSDRLIHYQLLNAPPLIHARKRRSVYRNDLRSYKALVELLTRARIAGIIPFNAIADPTRPVTTWDVFRSPGPFIRRELDNLFKGFWRDLQAPQPCHVEIVGEKNTLAGIIRPVAADYCIPFILGRGYSSLPPRHDMAERFRQTGKERLILLVLSDQDPEGDDIPHSFARSMRDDFGIKAVDFIKVALTAEQVRDLGIPPGPTASEKRSSRRERFVQEHGEHVYELEAVEPERLQQILRQTIESVIDMPLFRAEQEKERQDAAYIAGVRKTIGEMLAKLELE
jgi:hypothetical protein